MSIEREPPDPHAVSVTVLENPFDWRSRTIHRAPWGRPLAEVIPARVTPAGDWVVIQDGRVIPPEDWTTLIMQPGGSVLCCVQPQDAITRIIGGVVLAAAGFFTFGLTSPFGVALMLAGAGSAIGGISTLLIGSPTVPTVGVGRASSATYGFGTIQNSVRPGAPIPVVYGLHRVGGQLIELFVRPQNLETDTTGPGTVTVTLTTVVQQVDDPLSGILSGAQTDAYFAIAGVGTAFLTQCPAGTNLRINGRTYTVRLVDSDTLLRADSREGLNTAAGQTYLVLHNTGFYTSDSDVLHALLALSEGDISAISAIEINGQPSSSYRNVLTETRLGLNTQGAITLFGDGTPSAQAADAAISQTFLVWTTVGTNLTAFELEVTFPQGLFTVNDDGSLGQAAVTLHVEYERLAAPGYVVLGEYTIADSKRTVLRRQLRAEGLTAGQYHIQVKRLSPESTAPRRVDAVRRTTINEIVNDAYTYPNVALLAVKVVATDQISGGVPTITALVQGRNIRIFSSVSAFITGWSDNPAWIVFDMLTHPRYGMGTSIWPIWSLLADAGTLSVTNGSAVVTGVGTGWLSGLRVGVKVVLPAQGVVLTVSSVDSDTQFTATAPYAGTTASGLTYEAHRDDLDIQSFIDWAAFCDALVDNGAGGTEKRATCDLVLDSENELSWDAVLKVCGLGFATPVKMGNHIRMKFQQAESPVQLFTMSNVVAGSLQEQFLSLKDRANYFECEYLNAANNYAKEIVTLEDPLLFTNSEPARKQTVSVLGVTRRSHAARLAKFYGLANRYVTRTIQFDVGLDAAALEPGDVFRFQHDVPQWGALGTRAAPGSTASTIILDHPVTIGSGTWQILVRHADDTVETQTITSPAGTYAAGTPISISLATWAETPADGDVVAIGSVALGAVKLFRLIALERTNDFTARLTGVEYNAALYDASLTNIQAQVFATMPRTDAPPAQVTDLALTPLSDAARTVMVSFEPPTDVRFATAAIYQILSGRAVKLGESKFGSFAVPGVAPGTVLTIKVVAMSLSGALADFGTAPVAVLTVTGGLLPPNVTGLELIGQGHSTTFVGRDAKFGWRDRAISSGGGLEPAGRESLGAGAGNRGAFKNYRVEIYNTDGTTLRRRDYVTDAAYTYSHEKNVEDGTRLGSGVVRSFLINVWQQDVYNRLSAQPATLTVSNPAPTPPGNLSLFALGPSLVVRYDPQGDLDLDGYLIFRSTTPGFTPSGVVAGNGTCVYKGRDTTVAFQDVVLGTVYYLRVAAYDTFGTDALVYSAQVQVTATGLTAAQIQGTINALKLNLGTIQLTGVTWTNNSPSGGSVAWSGLSVTLNGVTYPIADGNTSNSWLYWTLGAEALTTSAVFPSLTNQDYLLAWNDGGTLRSLWNNFLKKGVITGDLVATSNLITLAAQIASATILNAHIVDATILRQKILFGELSNAASGNSSLLNYAPDNAEHVLVSIGGFVTTGGTVLISASGAFSGPSGDALVLRIYRDGILIASAVFASQNTYEAVHYLDAVLTGTHTYELRAVRISGTGTTPNQKAAGQLLVAELRR